MRSGPHFVLADVGLEHLLGHLDLFSFRRRLLRLGGTLSRRLGLGILGLGESRMHQTNTGEKND